MARRSGEPPRRQGRIMALLVVCCVVFVLFFGRLAWMQFVMADHYAEKAAQASSASGSRRHRAPGCRRPYRPLKN